MDEREHKLIIRRILVALDGSPHSQAALEAAVNLAALLHADLTGVFVEDINLLRLAQLPFASEVQRHTATSATLDITRIERELRLQAEKARHALQAAAHARALSFTFRVTRGPVSAEVLAAALDADLLALGRVSHGLSSRPRLGSTAQTAVRRGARTILLMRPTLSLDQPVLVIYDGRIGSERALVVASYLAQENGRLQILLWADTDAQTKAYETIIRQQLQNTSLTLEFRRLQQPDSTNLAYIMRLSGLGLLVLSDADSSLPPESIHTLLEELDYPILLVR